MLGEEQGEAAGEGSPDMTRDSVELELDRVPPFSRLNALQFNRKRLIDLMAKLWAKPTIGNVRRKNLGKCFQFWTQLLRKWIISPDCLPAPLPTSPCKKSFEIVCPDDVLGDVELHQPTEEYIDVLL